MTTNVAISGSYSDALYALTINPLVQSESKARLILDEMLEAHKEYLPEFREYFESKNNGRKR